MKIIIYTDGLSKEVEQILWNKLQEIIKPNEIKRIVTKEFIWLWKPFKFQYKFWQKR
jgi:hypothetical protein